MLFALTPDDKAATIHIFQPLSFTYFMPSMVFINLSSALKRLILELANTVARCRITHSESVVGL